MRSENGKTVIACPMADEGIGNCSTCMYMRTWLNCRRLHEGDDPFCENPDVVKEAEVRIMSGSC